MPGPVILTSQDGSIRQRASGGIAQNLAGAASVAAVAGPAGHTIVGSMVQPGGGYQLLVWWSRDLTSWTEGGVA